MPKRRDRSGPAGSLEAGAAPLDPSRLLLCALRARPRVGVLAASWTDLHEVTRVAVAPALATPCHHHPVAWHDHQDGGVLLVALVAHHQARVLWSAAGLDPRVSPAAQLAAHQYSSGSKMVVTERSASVMIQTLPAEIS